LHENQLLEIDRGQSEPRNCAFSVPVSQPVERAGPKAALRAYNLAGLGSLLEVSKVSRFSMQAIAARRGGSVSHWHDQPEV
jgi:hypothetical protein